MRKIIVNSTACFLLCMGIVACGQKGVLYLPTQPEAANRATLPQALLPFAHTPKGTSSMQLPTVSP